MDEKQTIELENQVQSLLAGELCEADTALLLGRIAREDDVRRILRETIDLQTTCRSLIGCDARDGEGWRSTLSTTVASGANRGEDAPVRSPKTPRHRRLHGLFWLVRVAAAVVVVASVYVAIVARHDSRLLRSELVSRDQGVVLPEATGQELMNVRKVWAQVSAGSEGAVPWVFLSDGGGEFGYMAADPGRGGAPRLILLHCFIVGADGREVKRIRMLVPAQAGTKVAVQQAGSLSGHPIQLVVSSSSRRAGLDLSVGHEGLMGVRGSTPVGGGGTEIGQFQMDGRRMSVFLRAILLAGGRPS
ncbi:MAG: hypothetical protein HQ546_05075 [Planctomycetes bacterium]|nr:hypothetical protein [Planctomycetota bacterium]